MDVRKQLLFRHSKENTNLIVSYIGDSQKLFDQLMKLFMADEYRVTQRAAWVVGDIARIYPELIVPHFKKMVLNLRKPFLHDAVKRNTLRILQESDIPKVLWGDAADICFNFMLSKTEPIATKVFSMTVLFNISKDVPEFREELAIIIEDQLPYSSAGFKSRGKKTLIALHKIKAY
jgi:hypothetical protein